MELQNLNASAYPGGNRVDLRWLNPRPELFTGVRVIRGQYTYPNSALDETWFRDIENPVLFSEESDYSGDLDNKTLPAAFAARFGTNGPGPGAPVSVLEPGSRWQTGRTENSFLIIKHGDQLDVYGMSGYEDDGLKAEEVYYYSLFPYKGDPAEYLDHSANRASAMATGAYDFAGEMYRTLPAVYHRYDTALPGNPPAEMTEQDKQRGQLRRFLDLPGMQLDRLYSKAAALLNFHDIYRTDGRLLPLLAQWIDWDTDHNLDLAAQRSELRNAPALYETTGIIPAIEAVISKCIGGWKCRTKEFLHNVTLSNSPEQLNLWLRQPQTQDSPKYTGELLSLDFAFEGRPSVAPFKDNDNRVVNQWLFFHTLRNGKWNIHYKTAALNEKEEWEWTPSQNLSEHLPKPDTGVSIIHKHPSAVFQEGKLWVFWDSYDEETRTWSINHCKRTDDTWLNDPNDMLPGNGSQRKSPQAVVDHEKRLWLFWLEKDDGQWKLKYNRHNGSQWENNWAIGVPADSRIEKDLFVVFQEKGNAQRIWVFGSRKKTGGEPWQDCREIAYRVKTNLGSLAGNWGGVQTLPKLIPPDGIPYDDLEPAAAVNADNELELYWVSNRTGGKAIWKTKIQGNGSIDLNDAEMLMDDPYSQRTPLPLMVNNSMTLIYRSNRCISYENEEYRATRTTDFRYSGSTTLDRRDTAKFELRGTYDDFQTYTHTTGKNGGKPDDNDWYARDTIGVYISPLKDNQQYLTRSREFIKGILERFLPIQIRAVFVIEPPKTGEHVYTDEKDIRETFTDEYSITVPEKYPGTGGEHKDKAPGWIWFRTWGDGSKDHRTVNFIVNPENPGETIVENTQFRTRHISLETGE